MISGKKNDMGEEKLAAFSKRLTYTEKKKANHPYGFLFHFVSSELGLAQDLPHARQGLCY
jgi:hypothetical protein